MRGQPKYKVGDVVKFRLNDDEKTGIVAIVDAFGTFFDDSDVSYDILNREERMLYKHFKEPLIIEKFDEVDPDSVWSLL